MRFTKLIAGLCIAATMWAAGPPSPVVLPAQQTPGVEKINWQAPPDPAASKAKPKKPKKNGGKGKWIALAAVAGAVAVTLILIDKRLNNEGAGIFR